MHCFCFSFPHIYVNVLYRFVGWSGHQTTNTWLQGAMITSSLYGIWLIVGLSRHTQTIKQQLKPLLGHHTSMGSWLLVEELLTAACVSGTRLLGSLFSVLTQVHKCATWPGLNTPMNLWAFAFLIIYSGTLSTLCCKEHHRYMAVVMTEVNKGVYLLLVLSLNFNLSLLGQLGKGEVTLYTQY